MRIILMIILLLSVVMINAQSNQLKPYFDERTELLSVVFMLSGANEYQDCLHKEYNESINTHFDKYKAQPVINLAKELRSKYGVAYNAPMSLAVHLIIKDNTISFNPDLKDDEIDYRWKYSIEDRDEFIRNLNDFYQKTDFHNFFIKNKDIYNKYEEQAFNYTKHIDLNWFKAYFGVTESNNSCLILSLINCHNSYGASTISKENKKTVISVFGIGGKDDEGKLIIKDYINATIVHELNHSYCNPVIDKNIKILTPTMKVIYKKSKKQMVNSAYGSIDIVLYEYLVRTATLRYQKYTGADSTKINLSINSDKNQYFYFVKELYDIMDEYENNRDKYKDMSAFMPEFGAKLKEIGKNYDKYYKKAFEGCPILVECSLKNNKTISPSDSVIYLKFDRPMKSNYGFNDYSNSIKLPSFNNISWIDDKTLQVTLGVEENTKYGFSLYTRGFISKEGRNLQGYHAYKFKTGKKKKS